MYRQKTPVLWAQDRLRLPLVSATYDPLSRIRAIAATAMFLAGVLAIAGSLLDWVTLTLPPTIPTDQLDAAQPFNGLEARDGWVTLGAGVLLMLAAAGLMLKGRRGYASLGILAAILIGAIAIADFRAVEDPHSGLSRRTERVGDADPGTGLFIIGIAGVMGLLASVSARAATDPSTPSEEATT